MVAPSKLFTSPINCFHCSQVVLHPGVGCCRHFLNNILLHGSAGLKYFSPLLITPLVLKYKIMNWNLFVNTVKYYLQTVCFASLCTASVFFMICCLRNVLGCFRTYTTLFLPSVLGMQFCWFFPARVMKLFTTATSQAVLEGLLRQNSNKFTHLILHSPLMQTILFMIASGIILHYKRKNIYKDFWFIQPIVKINENKTTFEEPKELANGKTKGADKYYNQKCKTKCDHINSSCGKFLLEGIKSYLIYGIPLDLLAMLMKGKIPSGTQGLMQKVIKKAKTFRPNMTGFFISYVGIYRLSACLLRKYYGDYFKELQHIISAFLGGLSFMCVKRVNFVSLSLVISTQLLWEKFCCSIKSSKSGKKPNLVLLMLKNARMSEIIFSLNCGYLVHNYILHSHLVNSLAKGFMDGLTCDKPKNIRNIMITNDIRSLVEFAKQHTIKTFL